MTNEKNLEIEKKIEDIRNSFDQIFNSYLIGNETKIIEYFDENTDNYHTYCDSKFITTASRNKPYVLTYFILKNKGLFNTNFHKNYLSKENKLIKSQKVYSDTIKGIDTPQFDTFNILGYFVFKEKWKYINATTYQSYLNYYCCLSEMI